MAAKKTSKQQSKASFVRALPASLSAAEVVEKAKAVGISLEVGYVYNIRSTAKAAGKTPRTAENAAVGRGRPKSNGAASSAAADSSSAEMLLKALGAELGLASAIRILEGERARVRAAIGK